MRIAITKGRLEKDTVTLLEAAGYPCDALIHKGRRLILPVGEGLEAVLCKANDVVTFVERGVCDFGVVGKDTLMERPGNYYNLLDLGYGRCDFILAAPEGSDFYGGYAQKRVATKYENVTRRYFAGKNMDIEVIKIEGSVELAPLLHLSDGIVDLMETGTTLKENHLRVIEKVAPVSAQLIANAAHLKMKKAEMETLLRKIEEVVR